jgi:hypothetical protein
LKGPESQEWKELFAHTVETVILASFQDSEEQETRQSRSPEHDEDRAHDITRDVSRAAQRKGDDGENHEVCASGKVGELVELERKRDCEEEELVCQGDEKCDGEIVAVEDVHGSHVVLRS